MSQIQQPPHTEDSDVGSEEITIVSVGRTPEEKRAAFEVEWRDPANPRSWIDQLKTLF
jgi:hypothetical protein